MNRLEILVLDSRSKTEKAIRDAYDLGRADKYQEITSEYMLLTEKQVADIRAEAIDEFVELLNEHSNCTHYESNSNNTFINKSKWLAIAEQMKGDKE